MDYIVLPLWPRGFLHREHPLRPRIMLRDLLIDCIWTFFEWVYTLRYSSWPTAYLVACFQAAVFLMGSHIAHALHLNWVVAESLEVYGYRNTEFLSEVVGSINSDRTIIESIFVFLYAITPVVKYLWEYWGWHWAGECGDKGEASAAWRLKPCQDTKVCYAPNGKQADKLKETNGKTSWAFGLMASELADVRLHCF